MNCRHAVLSYFHFFSILIPFQAGSVSEIRSFRVKCSQGDDRSCGPRGLLEQQFEERSFCHPQQEQARQP